MQIPVALFELYKDKPHLVSFVSAATGRISAHVEANRFEFFPEFTEHGVSHLEQVLGSAIELATSRTRALFTPEDAAILTVAVALHDFGMYLTRDGFETLIDVGSPWRGILGFADRPWHELWTDFLAEASRFDGRKLRTLFGEKYRPARHPPPKNENWEDFDYLLVGEFVRRHHPRLAHEISVTGMPGKDGASIIVCPSDGEQGEFLCNMSGTVARSHGISLRTSLAYLETTYRNRVDPRRIHAPLHMVLLRIADYFQIQGERAPSARTDVSSFRSPLSDREWRVHQCVTDINNTGSDPEALIIDAHPPDVEVFLRIKSWIADLQRELDTSWAVLGEVYGLQTHNHLSELGLRIRRIKSNLDNVDEFSKHVSYVPERLRFETSNADLLKLLIGPLYANDPGVGIRELLQNSVDAVLEFDEFVSRRPELSIVLRNQIRSDVYLHIHTQDKLPTQVIVSDRGIGMTLEIVREYFLKAGASFRRSDAWREAFEEKGSSRILRSGRFGVGALAAFLLGDEIEVTTRHVTAASTEGLQFTARVDDDVIHVRRISCPVGTKIVVKVPKEMRELVKSILPWRSVDVRHGDKWGHYFGRYPKVMRSINGTDYFIPEEDYLPSPEEVKHPPWRRVNAPGDAVFWTYQSAPEFSCNAIIVGQRQGKDQLAPNFVVPNICAYDKDGNLPINLQRNMVAIDNVPFRGNLITSIVDDLIAYALLNGPDAPESRWFQGDYPGFYRREHWYHLQDREAKWLLCKKGFVFNDPGLVNIFAPTRMILGIGGQAGYSEWGTLVVGGMEEKDIAISTAPRAMVDGGNKKKGILFDALIGPPERRGMSYGAGSLFVSRGALANVDAQSPGRGLRAAISSLSAVAGSKHWYQLEYGGGGQPAYADMLDIFPREKSNPMLVAVMEISRLESPEGAHAMSERWMTVLGTPIIPFDQRERKKLVKRAEGQIGPALELYRLELKRKKKEVEDDI